MSSTHAAVVFVFMLLMWCSQLEQRRLCVHGVGHVMANIRY